MDAPLTDALNACFKREEAAKHLAGELHRALNLSLSSWPPEEKLNNIKKELDKCFSAFTELYGSSTSLDATPPQIPVAKFPAAESPDTEARRLADDLCNTILAISRLLSYSWEDKLTIIKCSLNNCFSNIARLYGVSTNVDDVEWELYRTNRHILLVLPFDVIGKSIQIGDDRWIRFKPTSKTRFPVLILDQHSLKEAKRAELTYATPKHLQSPLCLGDLGDKMRILRLKAESMEYHRRFVQKTDVGVSQASSNGGTSRHNLVPSQTTCSSPRPPKLKKSQNGAARSKGKGTHKSLRTKPMRGGRSRTTKPFTRAAVGDVIHVNTDPNSTSTCSSERQGWTRNSSILVD